MDSLTEKKAERAKLVSELAAMPFPGAAELSQINEYVAIVIDYSAMHPGSTLEETARVAKGCLGAAASKLIKIYPDQLYLVTPRLENLLTQRGSIRAVGWLHCKLQELEDAKLLKEEVSQVVLSLLKEAEAECAKEEGGFL